jgi:uncharacterized repeat protein (TIGR03803 family)
VFKLTKSGAETVLHSFNGKDGYAPNALRDIHGTLYGTADLGGTDDSGTVFSMTLDGTTTVIWSFGQGNDGAYPRGLINVAGKLYGTTFQGGASGQGTVFAVAP